MPKKTFEDKYPNIARWIYEHDGTIEIGYPSDGSLTSFIRAIDRVECPGKVRMNTNR